MFVALIVAGALQAATAPPTVAAPPTMAGAPAKPVAPITLEPQDQFHCNYVDRARAALRKQIPNYHENGPALMRHLGDYYVEVYIEPINNLPGARYFAYFTAAGCSDPIQVWSEG